MGPLRNKLVSVRLEEEAYLQLRRHSLRSGVPTSALVHRWLQEQGDEESEAMAERGAPNAIGNRGFSARKERLEWRRKARLAMVGWR